MPVAAFAVDRDRRGDELFAAMRAPFVMRNASVRPGWNELFRHFAILT
jgi:hypothetical protein